MLNQRFRQQFIFQIKFIVRVRNERNVIRMNLKEFWDNYKGAIIGIVVAILILITRLHDLILAIVVLVLGAFIGNYVQQNKEDVKTKLKTFIDKM